MICKFNHHYLYHCLAPPPQPRGVSYVYVYAITGQNLKVIAYSYIELWSFKVTNLDVCGSLILSNPVTYHNI